MFRGYSRLLQILQRGIKRLIEIIFVDYETPLFQTNSNQISRRAERVVQPRECLVLRHRALCRREEFVELVQADRQSRAETIFLELDHLLDEFAVRLEFGIVFLHQIDDEVRYLIEKRTFESERVVPLVYRAAHDLAQDVVATFTAWKESGGNRNRRRARVVCDHAHRKSFLGLGFVVTIS